MRAAGLPDRLTSATLYCAGSDATNCLASSLAASNRLGLTSVDAIDWLTSSTSTMVARSRGTRSTPLGRDQAMVSAARLSRVSATAR